MEFSILRMIIPDIDFDFGRRFDENFAVNFATGGLANFWLRNLIDVAINTAIDAYNGKDLALSLAINIASAFGAESLVNAGGSLVKRFGRPGAQTLQDTGISVARGLLPDIPIRTVDGLRKVSELRKSYGVSKKINIAFAELDTGTGSVVNLAAIGNSRPRNGFVSPPGTPGGPNHRRFITSPNRNPGYPYTSNHPFEANPRKFDSEVILLENIANSIPTSSVGRLRLFSEGPICGNCQNVIKQFEKLFPGIEVITSSGVKSVG